MRQLLKRQGEVNVSDYQRPSLRLGFRCGFEVDYRANSGEQSTNERKYPNHVAYRDSGRLDNHRNEDRSEVRNQPFSGPAHFGLGLRGDLPLLWLAVQFLQPRPHIES